jgi:cytochrome b
MLAWSWPVRLCHWLLAGLVLFNLFNETGPVHRYAGYVAALTVVVRLIHGLSRSRSDPAHIAPPSPAALKQHRLALKAGKVERSLGHNPAGMCMAWLLWLLVLALGVTGWMTQLDAYWGEDWVIDTHTTTALVLQACILTHWAGVLLMSRLQRENLVIGMLTGRKTP